MSPPDLDFDLEPTRHRGRASSSLLHAREAFAARTPRGKALAVLANVLTLSRLPLGWLVHRELTARAPTDALANFAPRFLVRALLRARTEREFRRRRARVAALLLAAGVTDVLDGIVARRSGRTSGLGNALDPIADKAFALAVLHGLDVRHLLPRAGAASLLAREMLEAPLAALSVAGGFGFGSTRTPAANRVGKLATVAQFGAVFVALVAPRSRATTRALCTLAGAVGAAAGISYWRRALAERSERLAGA